MPALNVPWYQTLFSVVIFLPALWRISLTSRLCTYANCEQSLSLKFRAGCWALTSSLLFSARISTDGVTTAHEIFHRLPWKLQRQLDCLRHRWTRYFHRYLLRWSLLPEVPQCHVAYATNPRFRYRGPNCTVFVVVLFRQLNFILQALGYVVLGSVKLHSTFLLYVILVTV